MNTLTQNSKISNPIQPNYSVKITLQIDNRNKYSNQIINGLKKCSNENRDNDWNKIEIIGDNDQVDYNVRIIFNSTPSFSIKRTNNFVSISIPSNDIVNQNEVTALQKLTGGTYPEFKRLQTNQDIFPDCHPEIERVLYTTADYLNRKDMLDAYLVVIKEFLTGAKNIFKNYYHLENGSVTLQ